MTFEIERKSNITSYRKSIDDFVLIEPTFRDVNINPDEYLEPEIITSSHNNVFWILYLIGVLGMLVFISTNHIRIIHLILKSKRIHNNSFRIVFTNKDYSPMSYWKYIILPYSHYKAYKDDDLQLILNHEKSHIELLHHFDLLVCNLFQIVFWFNPFTYFLIKELKTVHEFQADSRSLKSQTNKETYQLKLIEQSVGKLKFNLASNFNKCQIKKRIEMMNSKPNNHKWRTLLLVPLLALSVFTFSSWQENIKSNNKVIAQNYQENNYQFKPEDFHMIDSIAVIGFGDMKYEKGQELFEHKDAKILMNKASRLLIGSKPGKMDDINAFIKSSLYYKYADQKTTRFVKVTTESFKDKLHAGPVFVQKDNQTSLKDFQLLLNEIGTAIVEIQNEYALEIFSTEYISLSKNQKQDLERIISFKSIVLFPDYIEK